MRIGVPICEDIWGPEPVECLTETGGEILLVPNGSPYRRGVNDERLNVAVGARQGRGLPLIYLNQVGGQDELVFDGASFVLNADRTFAVQLPAFREDGRNRGVHAHAPTAGSARRTDRGARDGDEADLSPPACWACATM